MPRDSRRFPLALVLVCLAGCKEPVEDQVPPPPPAVPLVRGEPPPEARPYVLAKPPPIRYPVKASFDGQIELLGYDVPKTRFRLGEPVPLTLYWKAVVEPTEDWQVFIHLDPEGIDNPQMRGYGDHYPVFGLYRTLQWKAGQIVRDQVTVNLRDNVPTARADLWMGLYIGDRRARLVTTLPTDGKNRLKLATFEVDRGGKPAPGKQYSVHRAEGKIAVDGRLDEPSWQKVPSTGRFVRAVGGGPAKHDTWAKLLWDEENLYVAVHAADPDIRSPYKKHDDPLWKADAVEVFLAPNGPEKSYVEIQVSPANVVFDAYFAKRKPPPDRGGDVGYTAGVRSAVRLNGTLNQPGDRDVSWTVEMAIPWKNLRDARVPPKIGDVWWANLIRVERTAGPVDDVAWQPPGNDYHNLQAMGRLVFAGPPTTARLLLGKHRLKLPAKLERRKILKGAPAVSAPP